METTGTKGEGLENLSLIHKMIQTVKEDLEDQSFYFLLWGWAVFVACIMNRILLNADYDHPYIGWTILMPLAAVATMIYGFRQDKKQRIKSYVTELMGYVLIAFLVSLFMILLHMNTLQLSTYPLVMMVYGMWLFISGGALRFRPLVVGGIINWILAIVAFRFDFETQLLLLAAAVLLGYIIPGHMLKARYNRQKSTRTLEA